MSSQLDRSRAAFLGLALGDAYGRPLEFVHLPQVRTLPVAIRRPDFRWTDDTHMSLYLARALADVGAQRLAPGHLDEDAVGTAIGRRFVEWSHDPLTPSTAPGGTCLRGAAAFAAGGDWRTSGVVGSDGCGSVMRVVPLALALDGEELIRAAAISSLVTHAHPNGVAAAVAGAWLCRRALLAGQLAEADVSATAALIRDRFPDATDVAPALEAALLEDATLGDWLDERRIPAGDGGWRGPSALGLAVAAALKWGRPRPGVAADAAFALAVEKAARIDGDSDSVACLAGMLLGAAYGMEALPPAWLRVLPEAGEITSLATAMFHLDQARRLPPPAPTGARTSLTHPLYVSWVLPPRAAASSALGITFLPGKRAPSLFGAPWHRDLGLDLDRLREEQVSLLVSLVEEDELAALGASALVVEGALRGLEVLRSPIPDGYVPTVAVATALAERARAELAAGRRVVVHCRGGLGRAGTVTACVLISLGRTAREALDEVRAHRPGAVENALQERFLVEFAQASARAG